MNAQRKYWDSRFYKEGKIWGSEPSKSTPWAHQFFKQSQDVNKLLVLGAGYGRNSRFFSQKGYNVSGIELSTKALEISEDFDPATKFYQGSVLNIFSIPKLKNEKFDAIYAFNVLHLFMKEKRKKLIEYTFDILKTPGYAVFTVFSDKEESISTGKCVEKNTFESKPGRPVHYFSEKDLCNHFNDFKIMEIRLYEESENHGIKGAHTHKLYYISMVVAPRPLGGV
jgi:SAM-dependent methyltransferase